MSSTYALLPETSLTPSTLRRTLPMLRSPSPKSGAAASLQPGCVLRRTASRTARKNCL